MITVLVVEDNLELRENTAEILELAGYYVLLGGSAEVGLDLAKSHRPDIVVFDIMIPPPDVNAFMNAMREDPATAAIPFVLLDGNITPLAVRQSIAQLNAVHLSKPFTREDLLDAVQKGLERNGQVPLA